MTDLITAPLALPPGVVLVERADDSGEYIALVEEAPVRIVLNGRELAAMMCTPTNLQELAIGWLYGEGFIERINEVTVLGACEDLRVVEVRTEPDRTAQRSQWKQIVTSGCGGGASFGLTPESLAALPVVRSIWGLSSAALGERMREMLHAAPLHRLAGAIHCAALTDGERLLYLIEDIGRHNAVDKVIGRALLRGYDLSRAAILCTGRIAGDMAYKAARAGVPVIASVTGTTSLAVQIARQSGVTLVTRAGTPRMAAYAAPERLQDLPAGTAAQSTGEIRTLVR
jgi:FdhD protein